jgi:hypothetical protein
LIRIWPSAGLRQWDAHRFQRLGGPLPPSTAMAVMVSASAGLMALNPLANLRFRALRGLIAAQAGPAKETCAMEEPAEVRVGRGQRLLEAVREDLDLFGVAELEERLEVLSPKPPA